MPLRAPLFASRSSKTRGRTRDYGERERLVYRGVGSGGAEQDSLDGPLHRKGDERPNTGMREGTIEHEQVNEAIRAADMTVIFGQQTRIRDGVVLPDHLLTRFHAGHDMVKFFYGAIRQLPDYFVTALLESEVSVTLVKGPELLVFRGPREYQAFHVGRTRRTLYLPHQILRSAWQNGYDYWSLTEVIIMETWPLLDYLLLLEFVRHCQVRLRTHYTLGYRFVRDTLLQLNQHRQHDEEGEKPEEDEFEFFFRHYSDTLFDLGRGILDCDPFDITDELFDENRERFWGNLKLYEIATAYRFPTYFHIDRDIVHGAAFRVATEFAIPLEPQSPADVIHDLWDEARFHRSRSLKTEELLERLLEYGANGIEAFYDTVAEEITYGFEYVTANRYDGYDIRTGFDRLIAGYSSGDHGRRPGSVTLDCRDLYSHLLAVKRRRLLEEFKHLSPHSQEENAYLMKLMLARVIEVKLNRKDVPDFQRRIEFTDSARVLIEAGEDLLSDEDDDRDTVRECLAGILGKLDRHPLFHSEFLAQYRSLTGDPSAVVVADIRPQVDRLAAEIPDRPMPLTSDPHGFTHRLLSFVELKKAAPSAKRQLTLLAGLMVRLDKTPDYDRRLELVRSLGESARMELEEIASNDLVYGDRQRARIRAAANELLEGLNGQS